MLKLGKLLTLSATTLKLNTTDPSPTTAHVEEINVFPSYNDLMRSLFLGVLNDTYKEEYGYMILESSASLSPIIIFSSRWEISSGVRKIRKFKLIIQDTTELGVMNMIKLLETIIEIVIFKYFWGYGSHFQYVADPGKELPIVLLHQMSRYLGTVKTAGIRSLDKFSKGLIYLVRLGILQRQY